MSFLIVVYVKEETSVKKIPQIIMDYFSEFPAIPIVNFFVAGYATDEGNMLIFPTWKSYLVTLHYRMPSIRKIYSTNNN